MWMAALSAVSVWSLVVQTCILTACMPMPGRATDKV